MTVFRFIYCTRGNRRLKATEEARLLCPKLTCPDAY
jgi:hypothetical protein